jgi:hypothetical protein
MKNLKIYSLVPRCIICKDFEVFLVRKTFSLVNKKRVRGFQVKLKVYKKNGEIIEAGLILTKL